MPKDIYLLGSFLLMIFIKTDNMGQWKKWGQVGPGCWTTMLKWCSLTQTKPSTFTTKLEMAYQTSEKKLQELLTCDQMKIQ